MAACL